MPLESSLTHHSNDSELDRIGLSRYLRNNIMHAIIIMYTEVEIAKPFLGIRTDLSGSIFACPGQQMVNEF